MKQIILASTSPRRREILSKLGISFVVEAGVYEEDMTLAMPPLELVKHLATGKADAVARTRTDSLVIASDTIVVFQGKALGKPKNKQHAIDTLKMLSGKENDIITAVAIHDGPSGKKVIFADTTKVFMKEMTEQDIVAYVENGEPMDKAGSYALQGLGAMFIDRIEGDFFNAMGLPLAHLAAELRALGVKIL